MAWEEKVDSHFHRIKNRNLIRQAGEPIRDTACGCHMKASKEPSTANTDENFVRVKNHLLSPRYDRSDMKMCLVFFKGFLHHQPVKITHTHLRKISEKEI